MNRLRLIFLAGTVLPAVALTAPALARQASVGEIVVAQRADPSDDNGGGKRERAEKRERDEKPDRSEKPDRAERAEKPDRADKPDRAERAEKPDRPDKPDRAERAEKPDRPSRERPDAQADSPKDRKTIADEPAQRARPDAAAKPAAASDDDDKPSRRDRIKDRDAATPDAATPNAAKRDDDSNSRSNADRIPAARDDDRGDRKDRLKDMRDDRQNDRNDDRRDRADDRAANRRDGDRDLGRDERRDRFESRMRDDRRDDADSRRDDDRMDRVRGERRERRDGDVTIITEGDRTIYREGGRTYIRRDENLRFRDGARDVREERNGDTIKTVVTRPDGSKVVTVTDGDGRLISRTRTTISGEDYVLIDNRPRGGGPRGGFVDLRLPPPRVSIPREEYIVDADDASYEQIDQAFSAPPVERIERSYSLDEIRQNAPLRERVRSVDLDTVTFDTGSWDVRDDQIKKLENVGLAMEGAIKRNPRTVFMVEGHTDAVGNDDDNLSLSDRRAQAVAEILSKYFTIPAENLTTQGYGEQYLKVKVDGPEERNRRVTVRNITQLLTSQK